MKQTEKNTTSKKTVGIRTRARKVLDKYAEQVLFPDKLAKANKLLKGVKGLGSPMISLCNMGGCLYPHSKPNDFESGRIVSQCCE